MIEQQREQPPESRALRRAIESAASLTGSMGGAAAGLVLGVPLEGAAVGWMAGEFVRAAATVAADRLSRRAETRVGSVFLLADGEVSARVMAGEVPRDDLREEISPGRSPAEELVEATLLAAAQTYEERKLPYLAHLLAAIPFEPDLSYPDANQLIRLADTLTYRQLVILAAFAPFEPGGFGGRKGIGGEHLRGEYLTAFEESDALWSLRVDLLTLFHQGLVLVEKREKRMGRHSKEDLPWPAIPQEINPDALWLSTIGARLAQMMRLDTVLAEDREALVIDHLRWPDS